MNDRTIAFADAVTGTPHMVKAVRRGALAIHSAAYRNAQDGGALNYRGYNVTHVQSGFAIVHCASAWKARRALRALNAIGAWDVAIPLLFDRPDLSVLSPSFVAHARAVHAEFGERP